MRINKIVTIKIISQMILIRIQIREKNKIVRIDK